MGGLVKSLCGSLHVDNYMFYSATVQAGKGKEAIKVSAPSTSVWFGPIIISVRKLLLFLHNRQWKTFALWRELHWSFAHISAQHSPLTINIVQMTDGSLAGMVSTLAGSPEVALWIRFLTRPFLSVMPDWALINMDSCAQRPCPPCCAESTNANTLACKTSVRDFVLIHIDICSLWTRWWWGLVNFDVYSSVLRGPSTCFITTFYSGSCSVFSTVLWFSS